jgi:hypothetical protein
LLFGMDARVAPAHGEVSEGSFRPPDEHRR